MRFCALGVGLNRLEPSQFAMITQLESISDPPGSESADIVSSLPPGVYQTVTCLPVRYSSATITHRLVSSSHSEKYVL
jgi:hypothetical protein